MARKRDPSPVFLQSAAAAQLIRDAEQPAALRAALRLTFKGGRKRVQRCRGCGKHGVILRTWIPDEVRKVESTGEGIAVYWVCARCHGTIPEGPPPC